MNKHSEMAKNQSLITFKTEIMQNEREPKSDLHDHNDHLPKDVLNTVQDPDSMKDPLEQQLEKSKHMNSEKENKTLEDVKRKNRGED